VNTEDVEELQKEFENLNIKQYFKGDAAPN